MPRMRLFRRMSNASVMRPAGRDATTRCLSCSRGPKAGFERDGDRRGAAGVAMRLAQEHYQRNHDAVTGVWVPRAAGLLEGEPDCHETGLLLWLKVRGMLFGGNAGDALAAARQCWSSSGDASVTRIWRRWACWIRDTR